MSTLLDSKTLAALEQAVRDGEQAQRILDAAGISAEPEPAAEPEQTGEQGTEDSGASATVTPITKERVDTAAARQWLRDHGHTVSQRGRIGAELLDLYRSRPAESAKAAGAKSRKTGSKTASTKTAGVPPTTFREPQPARRRTARSA